MVKSFINRGNWTDDPCYYVSVQRDDGKHAFVLGPFQHESDCRQWAYRDAVDGGNPAKRNALQDTAEKLDPQAVWYAWGMAKAPNGHREAILNKYFVDHGNTFELSEEIAVEETHNQNSFGKEQQMSNAARKARKANAAKKAKAVESETETKTEGQVLAEEANVAKTKEKEDKILKISRKDAAAILKAVGFKETHKYDNRLMVRRLGKLGKYMEDYEGTLDGDTQELVDRIIKAGPDEITVTGEEPKDTKKDGGDKPAKKASEKGGKTGGRKTTGELDAFGSHIGSNNAKVNAMLSKTPITMAEIKAKMGGTYYNHLNAMVKAGKAKKTDKGYILIK